MGHLVFQHEVVLRAPLVLLSLVPYPDGGMLDLRDESDFEPHDFYLQSSLRSTWEGEGQWADLQPLVDVLVGRQDVVFDLVVSVVQDLSGPGNSAHEGLTGQTHLVSPAA